MECPKCESCSGRLEPVFNMIEERLVGFMCPQCMYFTKPIGREWRFVVDDWWEEKDNARRECRRPGWPK